jgi:hypothetical protein
MANTAGGNRLMNNKNSSIGNGITAECGASRFIGITALLAGIKNNIIITAIIC